MPAAIPTAPVAESFVSFACRQCASRVAQNRSFLSLAYDMPASIPTVPIGE
jgi:hypothetical protein